MYNMPENPIIASYERTGYAPDSSALKRMTHVCRNCNDANPDEMLFEWDGEYYCDECIKDIILDLLRTSPREFANTVCEGYVTAEYE